MQLIVKLVLRYAKILLNTLKNRTILLALFLLSTSIYLFIDNQFYQRYSGSPIILSSIQDFHPIIYSYLIEKEPAEKYLIDTPGCKIDATLIIPEYYKGSWKIEKIPDCDYEASLYQLDDQTQILRLNSEYQGKGRCCLHEILRKAPGDDNGFRLGPCEPLETALNVSGKELLLIKCGNSLNFEANLPLSPTVQEKLTHWKGQKIGVAPFNVLILGIDTTSRSQLLRSLPKTVLLLQQLGFIDFKGYFSPHGFTEGYFTNFLMGLTYGESRSACKPNWTVPWDACPFIWNQFSANNYVTLYVEDGHQSFNWGGQSGFKSRPTDYYSHQLFTAMEELRPKYSGIWKVGNKLDMYAYCASNETVPQFLIRYLQRFVQKFTNPASRSPFFGMSWHAYPFHDHAFALGNLDQYFYEFFKSLTGTPVQGQSSVLDNTLVILTADHGERVSTFQGTREGPQERYLPPFFIRIPTKLAAAHPEFMDALRWNANHLTTALDAHHTMLHLLSLFNLPAPSQAFPEFHPDLPDRSSLLLPVSANRTCDHLNETIRYCVCSSILENESITNRQVLAQLIQFAVQQLNLIVNQSQYANLCAEWAGDGPNSVISSRLTKKDDFFDVVLLQFEVSPGGAKFEVNIKIWYKQLKPNEIERLELNSEFSRISLYGSTSHCVKYETSRDKVMKEFCYCK